MISTFKKVENNKQISTFPAVGESDWNVVLFSSSGIGTVISKKSGPYDIGHFSNDWDMRMFKEVFECEISYKKETT